MSDAEDNLVKVREIAFCTLHPDANQAQTAAIRLKTMACAVRCEVLDGALLRVEYDVREITLVTIEAYLVDTGLHLDSHLVQKLKRALYHYTEETQRVNMGCPKGEHNCTQKVFATRYKRRAHGCRDDRPDYLRRYL